MPKGDRYESFSRLIPVSLVKEYYWCPRSAYYRLTLWAERPTHSMAAGGLDGDRRGRLLELLERERVEAREMLWEQPVESRRLGVAGRADLIVVTPRDTLVVVEAKLHATRRGLSTRQLHIAVQLAAYTIAAEESLAMPAEASMVYSVEDNRLIRLRIGPRLRRRVEHAARELQRALEEEAPPPAVARPWRCRVCSYRSICPAAAPALDGAVAYEGRRVDYW